jgi:RES domain-containing protein
MSRPYRLTGVGSVLAGGRWNVQKLIPALYFSTDAATVTAEADASAVSAGFPSGSIEPQTRIAFALKLQSVIDLTDANLLGNLGLSADQLLTCNWQSEQSNGREALTQAISRAAFEHIVEGLVVPSAQRPGGVNVIVFPAHLLQTSNITAHNESQIPFVHGL